MLFFLRLRLRLRLWCIVTTVARNAHKRRASFKSSWLDLSLGLGLGLWLRLGLCGTWKISTCCRGGQGPSRCKRPHASVWVITNLSALMLAHEGCLKTWWNSKSIESNIGVMAATSATMTWIGWEWRGRKKKAANKSWRQWHHSHVWWRVYAWSFTCNWIIGFSFFDAFRGFHVFGLVGLDEWWVGMRFCEEVGCSNIWQKTVRKSLVGETGKGLETPKMNQFSSTWGLRLRNKLAIVKVDQKRKLLTIHSPRSSLKTS